MLNSYAGIPFSYVAYIIDGNNDPIDLSAASPLTATFTHVISGNVVGPIAGTAAPATGYVSFTLSTANVAEPGEYLVEITYVISAVSETTFSRPLSILQRPLPSTISVKSGDSSLVKFQIIDPSGVAVNLTDKTVELYTQENHSVGSPTLVSHTVVSAISGLISASFTTSVDLFGHILVDSKISTEFLLNPVI